jgi:hypothetical protein
VGSERVEESVAEEKVVEEKRGPPEEGKVVVVLFPPADGKARKQKRKAVRAVEGRNPGIKLVVESETGGQCVREQNTQGRSGRSRHGKMG